MNDGRDPALLMLDIDHFKLVNDRWGHPIGDQAIQLAAATIRNNTRADDMAARYGGEEFAVLLPATGLQEAAEVGNRIRAAFEGRQIVARGSKQVIGSITISAGLARFEPRTALAEWVRQADAALYAAKAGGRNRLAIAPSRAPTS